MKYVKGISLFLVYSLMALGIGFYGGVKSSRFFYPNTLPQESAPAPTEVSAEEKDEEEAEEEEEVAEEDGNDA